MKYVVIIPDGAADLGLDELGGKTPLQVAKMPHLQALASSGRVGTVATTPPGWDAGADVCSMCLLGYDPRKFYSGRAPLEAAALGLEVGPTDWVLRLNFVTVGTPGNEDAGLMVDHSAGGISDREARALLEDLVAYWRVKAPELMADVAVHPGVGYRNILVDSSRTRDYAKVNTTPPHTIGRQLWSKFLPSGGAGDAAGLVQQLMSLSSEVLPGHEVNLARIEQGLRPANMVWIWGPGNSPSLPSFESRFGLKGSMITAVDLLAGISRYIGWERLSVPGLASTHDNDYAAQGRATVDAIDKFDIVCCHVESPDEASQKGDVRTKILALEAIDHAIVGPVVEKLKSFGDPEKDAAAEGWRVMVVPNHYTLVSTRKVDATPVPFMIAGAWVRSMVQRALTEADANLSDLKISEGAELMEYFLRGGLRNTGAKSLGARNHVERN